jgi:hypothetical protein
MVTSKTGFEVLYLGWRKIKQGQDTANSITNSLTRQAFAWNAALFSKITNPKLLGKPIDDAALKKLGFTQEDFVTGKKSIREKRQTENRHRGAVVM